MPWWSPASLGSRFLAFSRDYDSLQSLAVYFIYFQIFFALVGSLGAMFNGVPVVNLVVSLFALVAIESGSQTLGRTYAALLFIAVLLDVAWFILFSNTIWNFKPDEKYGSLFVLSLRLTLCMEIFGFSVRFLSSFVWIQMYRLGLSSNSTVYQAAEFDARNSFLSSTSAIQQNCAADDILGGSIYDHAYYSSLFEDAQDNGTAQQVNHHNGHTESSSTSAVHPMPSKPSPIRISHFIDVEAELRRPLTS